MTIDAVTSNIVRSVEVVSTGWVRIRPEHARSRRTPQLLWLLTSRSWTQKLPINVYVIDHPDGLVLFDTGQDRRSVTDPGYFPGGLAGWGFRRLAQFGIRSHLAPQSLHQPAGGLQVGAVRLIHLPGLI